MASVNTKPSGLWPDVERRAQPGGTRRTFFVQWLMLVATFLALAGFVANALHDERAFVLAVAHDRLSLSAKSIALYAERRLLSIDRALVDLRNNLPALEIAQDRDIQVTMYLDALSSAVEGIRSLGVLDAQGYTTESNQRELIGKNFGEYAFFQTIRKNPNRQGLDVSEPLETSYGAPTLNLAHTLIDARGEFAGLVVATLDPEDFRPTLASVRYTPDVAVGLIHGSGKVLLYLSSPDILPGTDISGSTTFFSRHLESGKEHSLMTGFSDILVNERLAAAQTVSPDSLTLSAPLVVVVSQEMSSVLQVWRADVRNQSLLWCLLASISSLSLFVHQRRQYRFVDQNVRHHLERQHDLDRLELATRASGTGIWELDIKGQSIKWDETMYSLYGKDRENFSSIYSSWRECIVPEDLPAVEAALQASITRAEEFEIKFRIRRGDGDIRVMDGRAWVYRDEEGKPARLIGVNRDITKRQLAEEEIRNAQRTTQQFLDHLPGTAYVKDESLRVLMANKAFKTQFGIDPDSMIGKNNTELFPGDFGEKLDADDQRVLASGQGAVIQENFAGRHFETSKFIIEGEAGKKMLGGITLDVTERRKHFDRQQALLKISELGGTLAEKDFLEQGLEMLERLTDSQIGFIHFVNDDQKSLELVGWTRNTLKACAAVSDRHYPMDDAGIWADCARNRTALIVNDYPGYCAKKGLPEGHVPLQRLISVPVIEEGKVRVILGIGNKPDAYDEYDCATTQLVGNDLSRIVHRQRTEAELKRKLAELIALNARLDETNNRLLQSEKLAAIGQLAAGVAHEINNPIGYVSSNLSTLSDYVNDLLAIAAAYDELDARLATSMPDAFRHAQQIKSEADYSFMIKDVRQLLVESHEGLERVRKIVQDLKDFSRVDSTGWQRANLHDGLESTLNIVWNEIKYKAEVDREYGELPEVYCIPSQINQVFMNLMTNAAQAIAGRGHIVLRSGREEHTVWVEVQDDGEGIRPDRLDHIFEPFYTTKPVGQGTGLGLSLSWSIVQRHHGRIEVRSVLGQGTTFRIILPIERIEAAEPIEPIDPQPATEPPVETMS